MRIILVLAVLVVLSVAQHTRWYELDDGYTFATYAKEFNKVYDEKEYVIRKAIFDSNLAVIRAHNANPHSSYKKGVNHLTDRSREEFRKMLGYKPSPSFNSPHMVPHVPSKDINPAPASIDWREEGVITPVKDQGECGSCWSFATAETVESYYAIKTGKLQELSEQNILDCTLNPNQCGGTGGCGGATAELGFDQIIAQGGLASEWRYPYQSFYGVNYLCRNVTPAVKIRSYSKLQTNLYNPIISALSSGPLAISVDASAWHDYETGIFDGCNTTGADINHAVQLVGYGSDESGNDYYIVRNSWNPNWGEDGYIRIAKNETDVNWCVIDDTPQDGSGCKDGPKVITVCGPCGILYDTSYVTL